MDNSLEEQPPELFQDVNSQQQQQQQNPTTATMEGEEEEAILEVFAPQDDDVGDGSQDYVNQSASYQGAAGHQPASCLKSDRTQTLGLVLPTDGNNVYAGRNSRAVRFSTDPTEISVISIPARSVSEIDIGDMPSSFTAGPSQSTSQAMTSQDSLATLEVETSQPPIDSNSGNSEGNLKLGQTCTADQGDTFYALGSTGDPLTYAVGTSRGNVFVLYAKPNAELQQLQAYHLHNGPIWDIDYCGPERFTTASSDSLSAVWNVDRNTKTAARHTATRLASEVYCSKFSSSGRLVGLGGNSHKFTIRSISSAAYTPYTLESSVQSVIACPQSDSFVCGMGDGTMVMVDPEADAISGTWPAAHAEKIPALAATSKRDSSTFLSCSFDGRVKLWDCRDVRLEPIHSIKFKKRRPVTGIEQDGYYIAACVGQSLVVLDSRNTSQIVGGSPNAWNGFTRALAITVGGEHNRAAGTTATITTASPDGIVRFWSL